MSKYGHQVTPPKWPLKLLRSFLKEEYLEEIEGDMEERFQDNLEIFSVGKARRLFAWDALKLMRPVLIKSFSKTQNINHSDMFKHNLILTLRNFRRYKSTFLINLFGLSTGLASALFIYLWVNDEIAIDKFHEKDKQLYQVLEKHEGNGESRITNETSGPMEDLIKEAMPEVEYAAAVGPSSWPGYDNFTVSVDDHNLRGSGQYAGKDYFNIFSFELLKGNKDQVLKEKNSIVISEQFAVNLFGSAEAAFGKTVKINHEEEFLVSGIMENIPIQSTIQFDLVMPFEKLREITPWVNSWGNSGPLVYTTLKEGTDVNHFNEKFGKYLKERFGADAERTAFLKKFSNLYLFGISENEQHRIGNVRIFSTIALFILLIACINFMNLSTARASRRLKEIGIKKVVGARRKLLISQFFGESMIISILALFVAILLVAILIPEFNQITGKRLTLQPDANLLIYALIIIPVTGVISGSYPALYLSGFKPISVLKNAHGSSGSEAWVRKGLVIFQFSISIILIVCILVIYNQIEFAQNKNLGYNKDNIVWFNIEGKLKDNTETFLTELRRIDGVEKAAATSHRMVGHNWSTGGLQWEGRDPDDRTAFQIFGVDYGFMEMLDFEFIEGRPFSKDFGTDSEKIIFNELAIKTMGMADPIGNSVQLFGEKQIIGVVKNFHFESLHEEQKPLLFMLTTTDVNKIMFRIQEGREREVLDQIEKFYASFNPGFPFNFQFLDDNYKALYTSEQRISTLSKYFAGIAIIISCLGLFGLIAFSTEKRIKEIGIRKILGSGELGIVRLLSGDFIKMVFIANIIALPLSYIISSKWLESFAFRIELQWWYFVGAGSIALLIAWLSIGAQTIKAARISPIDSLKNE